MNLRRKRELQEKLAKSDEVIDRLNSKCIDLTYINEAVNVKVGKQRDYVNLVLSIKRKYFFIQNEIKNNYYQIF